MPQNPFSHAQRPLAGRWLPFGTSVFTEMTKLSNENRAINLAQGFPDFPGPRKFMELVAECLPRNHNQYAPSAGESHLRQQLSQWCEREYQICYHPDTEVTVTTGATEGIYAVINAVVNPGDRVLLLEPYFDCYAQAIANAGGKLVPVRLHAPDTPVGQKVGEKWALDWEEFAAITSTPFKLMILNSPHNPTGKVITRGEYERFAQAVLKHDALVMCDEVYEYLVYDGNEHVPFAEIDGMKERTFRISSAAKSFGFTGFKVGWVFAPPPLTQALRLVHQATVFCTNPHIQEALGLLLEQSDWVKGFLLSQRHAYLEKRNLLVDKLHQAGFTTAPCEGSYFVQANYSSLQPETGDIEFVKWLITNVGVAAIPPSVFYVSPPTQLRWLRFAFCKTQETLEEAGNRLAKIPEVLG